MGGKGVEEISNRSKEKGKRKEARLENEKQRKSGTEDGQGRHLLSTDFRETHLLRIADCLACWLCDLGQSISLYFFY